LLLLWLLLLLVLLLRGRLGFRLQCSRHLHVRAGSLGNHVQV
jgi:hypothetical protein